MLTLSCKCEKRSGKRINAEWGW